MRFLTACVLLLPLVVQAPFAGDNAPNVDEGCYGKVVNATQAGVEVQFHGAVFSVNETDPILGRLMFVPATGSAGFLQGSPVNEEPGRDADETQFTHVLTRALAVMETEVTRRMWSSLREIQAELGSDPSASWYSSGLDDPVQLVNWPSAILFANLLSIHRGLRPCYYTEDTMASPVVTREDVTESIDCDWEANGYRLPTEGEWEWFARAQTAGPFSLEEPDYSALSLQCPPHGTLAELESVGWFCSSAGERSRPAGLLGANPWGLKDVHGNVWEWCWDWHDSYPSETQTDYAGPKEGTHRVYRGGGWFNYARAVRSANRFYGSPRYQQYNVGFRLVRRVDNSGPQAHSHEWDFGDTGKSNERSPKHAYENPGVYTWSLKIVRKDGETRSQVGTITVNPVTPTSFAATVTSEAITSSEAHLSWSYSRGGIDGFRVQRKKAGASDWTDVARLPEDTFSYMDDGLDPATIYFYRVFACYGDLSSKPSEEVLVTTFPPYLAPAIVTQPVSVRVAPGHRAALQVRTAGSALTYQWYRVDDDTLVPIEGANASSFDTPPMSGPGSYSVRITNALGTVVSEVVHVTVDAALPPQPHKLYFPYVRSGPSGGKINGVVACQPKTAGQDGTVTFTVYQMDGSLMPVAYNPVSYHLGGNQQLARLIGDLTGTPAGERVGWAEVASSQPLSSFAQFGSEEALDGALAFREGSRELIFTRIYDAGSAFRNLSAKTYVSIANISDQPVRVRFTLYDSSGFPVAIRTRGSLRYAESQETIPAKGSIYGRIFFLLDMPRVEIKGGYLVANVEGEGAALVGLSILELPDAGTIMVLNAARLSEETQYFSAQIHSTPESFTNLKVLNASGQPRQVTLTATGLQGNLLAAVQSLTLQPGATLEKDIHEIFHTAPRNNFVGSLRLAADGPGVVGDIVFGQRSTLAYAAALPLQATPLTEAVFSQVVNSAEISTNLALFNPSTATANIRVEIYWADGLKAGTAALKLESGHSISRPLAELLPVSQDQNGGHLLVRSDQPLVSQILFSGPVFSSALPPDPPADTGIADVDTGDHGRENLMPQVCCQPRRTIR
jgi:formylglycine-generating enzyme required for sulfatase activity/PKD repeat protein